MCSNSGCDHLQARWWFQEHGEHPSSWHVREAGAHVLQRSGDRPQQDLGAAGTAQPAVQGDFHVSGNFGSFVMVPYPEGGYLRKVKDDRNAYNIYCLLCCSSRDVRILVRYNLIFSSRWHCSSYLTWRSWCLCTPRGVWRGRIWLAGSLWASTAREKRN